MRINHITSNYSFKGVRISEELSDFMEERIKLSKDPNVSDSSRKFCSKIVKRFREVCNTLENFPLDIHLGLAHDNHRGISVGLEKDGDIIELRSYPYINPKPKKVVDNCYKDIGRLILKGNNFKAKKMKF